MNCVKPETRGHKARGYESQCNVYLVAAGFMPACFGFDAIHSRGRELSALDRSYFFRLRRNGGLRRSMTSAVQLKAFADQIHQGMTIREKYGEPVPQFHLREKDAPKRQARAK